MKERIARIAGYTGAGLSVLAAVLTPFLLLNWFTRGVAATGVRIDPVYTGGAVARTIDRGAYRIEVHAPVRSQALVPRVRAFVQMDWKPVAALPGQVSEEVDVDGDGQADLRVRFAVPRDEKERPRADVEPLNGRFEALRGVSNDGFDRIFARVNDALVLRVPLRERP
jgi:hypothetical protein